MLFGVRVHFDTAYEITIVDGLAVIQRPRIINREVFGGCNRRALCLWRRNLADEKSRHAWRSLSIGLLPSLIRDQSMALRDLYDFRERSRKKRKSSEYKSRESRLKGTNSSHALAITIITH